MFPMKVLDVLTLGRLSLVIPDRTRDNSKSHQHWPELNLNLEVFFVLLVGQCVTMSSVCVRRSCSCCEQQ